MELQINTKFYWLVTWFFIMLFSTSMIVHGSMPPPPMPLPTTPPTTPPTTMPLPTTPPVPNVAPKNIAATSPRFFAIRITWNRIPPEKSVAGISYVVFVRKLELTAWKKLAILSSEVQSYTHQKVEENYHVYKVCGATGGGYGPNSTEVTARPSSPKNKIEDASFSAFATSLHFVNQALQHHTTAIYQVTSVENCHKKCIECQQSINCRCLSFNLQRQGSGGLHICEINHETADNIPVDLVKRDGYQYYTNT